MMGPMNAPLLTRASELTRTRMHQHCFDLTKTKPLLLYSRPPGILMLNLQDTMTRPKLFRMLTRQISTFKCPQQTAYRRSAAFHLMCTCCWLLTALCIHVVLAGAVNVSPRFP